MRECKACLAMAYAGKASLALQAYFQKPDDSCASLLNAPLFNVFALAEKVMAWIVCKSAQSGCRIRRCRQA